MSSNTRQPCGNPTGNSAATVGNGDGNLPQSTFTIAEAARLLKMSERTLRDRVTKGKILAERTDQGYRIAAVALTALRQEQQPPPAAAGNDSDDRQSIAAEIAALRQQLRGAHLAAKTAAQRMGEAHGAIARLERERERERDHLASEVIFLRQQLHVANTANAQLLTLLQRQQEQPAAWWKVMLERAGLRRVQKP